MEGSFGCSFDLDEDILCAVNEVENDYINKQTGKTTNIVKGTTNQFHCVSRTLLCESFTAYSCIFIFKAIIDLYHFPLNIPATCNGIFYHMHARTSVNV